MKRVLSGIHNRRAVLSGLALASAAAVLAAPGPALAAKPAVYQGGDGVAIDGTDPVSYFSDGRPVAGSPDITAEWNGATWRFSTVANRDAFMQDPERYAPQYGGYCAWAVARGYTASTVPEAWAIRDGKLYLNYSPSIHRRWASDPAGNIAAANRNWPAVLR